MVQFQRTSVDGLTLKAKYYLEQAIKRTPASTSRLDKTLQMAHKFGDLYTVHDGEMIGAIYVLIYDTPEGKVVSPVLVGGIMLHKWRDDLHDFLVAECTRVNGIAVRFIARRGWAKKYPMCKNIGTIYEWKPGGALQA